MYHIQDEMLKKMSAEMNEKKESFINEMIIKKGFERAIPTEKMRFQKVTRSISFDNWEYVFVDDGTKQGAFIVAVGPWECDKKFDYAASKNTYFSQMNYTFK